MSQATREELADAASTVAGVAVSTHFRQITKAGEGCIHFARSVPADNGFGTVATWQIWIALPQDLGAAEKWIDEHHDALVSALKRKFVLTSIAPAETSFGNTTTNVLIIEGNR